MVRISINDLKELIEFIMRKKQSYEINADEFNIAVQAASREMFIKRYGQVQDYQPGRPVPKVGWEMTQKVKDDLLFCFKSPILTVNSQGRVESTPGTVGFPTDYSHISTMRYRYFENLDCTSTEDPNLVPEYRKVDILPDAVVSHRLTSKLVKPTKKHPVATLKGTYIQVYPTDLARVEINYLATPTAPVWGFTMANGREQYDAATSTDPDWPLQVMNEIAAYTLDFWGASIREGDMIQWSNAKTRTGV